MATLQAAIDWLDGLTASTTDYVGEVAQNVNITVGEALAPLVLPLQEPLLQSNVLSIFPLYMLVLGHCLFMASLFRAVYRPFWLAGLVLSFFGSFGGGILTAYLWATPTTLVFGSASNMFVSIHVVCWWLMNYSPGDFFHKLFHLMIPFKIFCACASTYLRVNLIIDNIDTCLAKFPDNFWAPIFIGIISGSGGKYISDAAQLLFMPFLDRPAPELLVPTAATVSSSVIACVHLILVHGLAIVRSEVSASFVLSIFLAETVTAQLFMPLNWTTALYRYFRFVLNIPTPVTPATQKQKEA